MPNEKANAEGVKSALGEPFYRMLVSALETEEAELRTLNEGSTNNSITSIREFQESWIQYLLLKGAVRSRLPKHLVAEHRFIDLAAFDTRIHYKSPEWSSSNPLMQVELKQPISTIQMKDGAIRTLQKDVLKLAGRAKGGARECYAVWLVCGKTREEVDRCLKEFAPLDFSPHQQAWEKTPRPELLYRVFQVPVSRFQTISLNENIEGDQVMVPAMWKIETE